MHRRMILTPSPERARRFVLATLAMVSSLIASPAVRAKTVLFKVGGEQQINVQTAGDQGSPGGAGGR